MVLFMRIKGPSTATAHAFVFVLVNEIASLINMLKILQ